MRWRGSITAETAVALPALMFLLGIALWGVAGAAAQVSCVDAARAGARAAARGEPLPAVRAAVADAAPAGARVSVVRDSHVTRVEVTASVHPPLTSGLPPLVVHARAVTPTEPGSEMYKDRSR